MSPDHVEVRILLPLVFQLQPDEVIRLERERAWLRVRRFVPVVAAITTLRAVVHERLVRVVGEQRQAAELPAVAVDEDRAMVIADQGDRRPWVSADLPGEIHLRPRRLATAIGIGLGDLSQLLPGQRPTETAAQEFVQVQQDADGGPEADTVLGDPNHHAHLGAETAQALVDARPHQDVDVAAHRLASPQVKRLE